MGNNFEFQVRTDSPDFSEHCIDIAIAEVSRIEKLLTTFSSESETNRINRLAGISPVEVSEETFVLIQRSIRISKLTDGAFDLSYGSLDKRFWNFDRSMTSLPDPEIAKETVKLINYRNIILDHSQKTVFLKKSGMRIGFGGIGKGYAAEKVKLLLQSMGVKHGIINASGDIAVWGNQEEGKPFSVGICHPDSKVPFSMLEISNAAVATSGNYEKYVLIDGVKYSHTINPATGFPIHGIKSTTIICPNAELADAMATPVSVLGIEKGLNLINQMQHMECIIIDDENRLYTSKNIKLR